MLTLLVFLPPITSFDGDEFIKNRFNEGGVANIEIMTSTVGHVSLRNRYHFAIITYKDEEAFRKGSEYFHSNNLYNVPVNMKKMSAVEMQNKIAQKMSNVVPQASSIEIAENLALMSNANKYKCHDMLQQYKQNKDLDKVIHLLTTDLLVSESIEFCVSSLLLKGLDDNIKILEIIGTLFTELIIKDIFSIDCVNKGVNLVLKDWINHMSKYPYFLSQIASTLAQLLLKCDSYNFCHLCDSFNSLSSDVSSVLIMEILKIFLDDQEQLKRIRYPGGIVGLYSKWTMSENVALEHFSSCRKLINYIKLDRLGVFCISMIIYNEMKLKNRKEIYSFTYKWIESNFNSEIIDDPIFIRALTIATVFLNFKFLIPLNQFFNYISGELLAYFIKFMPKELSKSQIQAREVQCLYGIQIAIAVINQPPNTVLHLFTQLFRETIVSIESFNVWKDENQYKAEFIEDQETKSMALATLNWNDLLRVFESDN